MRHAELIDQIIVRVKRTARPGLPTIVQLERHSEGAQSIFGGSRASKIAKSLGPDWEVWPLERLKEF